MSLAEQIGQVLHAYVAARVDRSFTEGWLSQEAQSISDEDDEGIVKLFGRACSLFAELSYGHRTEAEVRAQLAEALAAVDVQQAVWTTSLTSTSSQAKLFVPGTQFQGAGVSFMNRAIEVRRSPVIA